MTNADKFQLCYERAREIVSAYRSEAPEGCDPQNSYVALATLVVGAGTAAYSAYSSNKSAKKQEQLAASAGKFKKLDLPDMPAYIPNNLEGIEQDALKYDTLGYQYSDQDFLSRHKPIVDAEKLFEQQVLKDQSGDTELVPQIQNEFMRAGLQGSLAAFGDTPGTLAPNSAGEANVARNLGINIMGFQDRNRANRQQSLALAEQLFPRRKFGLSGADAAQIDIMNNAGMNQWNQADYANQVMNAQYNATGTINQGNILAQAGAQAEAAKQQAIISAMEMAGKLASQYAGSRQTGTATNPYTTQGAYGSNGSTWKSNAAGSGTQYLAG